jgi:hypothetical protein
MKQYGVNVAQLAAAIGKPLTVVGDYLMAGGAPSGFGGYTPAGRTPPVNPTASSTNYGVSLGGGGGTGGSGLTTLPFTLPTSTPAGPTTLGGTGGGTTAAPAVTAAQNAGIADFWNKNSGDPQAIIAGMQQYGVNAEQLAAAIGKPTNAVGNYLMAGGADRGFGGYSPGIADTYIASASGGANMPSFARGGIASLAKGRLLNGPGDGVSDSIRASIDGHQPAALADGEYVIPARIVSELGNGSTKAGAQQLDAMMKRIQTTRRKATDIAANTRATKHLPA